MQRPDRPRTAALSAPRSWPTPVRVAAVVVVYLVVWALLDVVAAQFEADDGVSVWYPPPGLDLAVLLVLGVRWWPLLVASSALHVLVISPDQMGPLADVLYVVITAGGYSLAAMVLLRVLRIDPRLPTQRDVVWLVTIAAGAAALLVCAARVMLLTAVGVAQDRSLVLSIAGSWAGSATGITMLTPVLLLAARRWVRGRDGEWPAAWTTRPPLEKATPHTRSRLEKAAQAVVLLAAVWLAYSGAPGRSLDYTYLVYAPLLWIAVRGGLPAAAGAVLAANVLAVLLAGEQAAPVDGGIALQFGLVTLSVAGLLLGAQVSQRRRDLEEHRHASMHDALTGLANRALFDDRLAAAMASSRADAGHEVGMLFCDLDNFKQVNDSLGHAAGDQVLVEVARRLTAAVRAGDTVARVGGDEFALILDGVGDGATLPEVAAEVTSALAQPHRVDSVHDRVVVTVSVGSASSRDVVTTEDGEPAGSSLMRDADLALHRAKSDGRARHVAFDSAMHASALGRLSSESALRRALDDGEITVVYQPIVDLTDGRVVAAEALARWTTPSGEEVPPARFTALAEAMGLISALGRQVRARAVADAATWDAVGQPRLSLNVSGAELSEPDLVEGLLQLLDEAGLSPSSVAVEITETVLVGNAPVCADNLAALAGAGVHVVVDDFGTGFSSFVYLRRLPVSMLKVDRSFVDGLPEDRQDSAIVRAILAMATELELPVVAEGITTTAQQDFLLEHGCTLGQGYLHGRPGNSASLVSAAWASRSAAPASCTGGPAS